MDVKQPYRLLFEPIDPPDGAVDEKQKWRAIRSIKITGIEDTHG